MSRRMSGSKGKSKKLTSRLEQRIETKDLFQRKYYTYRVETHSNPESESFLIDRKQMVLRLPGLKKNGKPILGKKKSPKNVFTSTLSRTLNKEKSKNEKN